MSVALKEKINRIFDELSTETQAEIIDFAEFLQQKKLKQPQNGEQKKRVFGMHEGQGWMSDNFNAPLPDSFWLGEEIEGVK